MTNPVEAELRRIFAEDADHAPDFLDPQRVTGHPRKTLKSDGEVPSRFAYQRIGGGVLVAASVAGALFVAFGPFGTGEHPVSSVKDGPSPTSPPAATSLPPNAGRLGDALPDPPLLRCTVPYSVDQLDHLTDFAFDGKVVEIATTAGRGAEVDAPYVRVTFEVNKWYSGGTGPTAIVDMVRPDILAFESTPPSYQQGTRLLVSGNPRIGGAPMDDAVAEGCGFTRHYDQPTAQEWDNAYP